MKLPLFQIDAFASRVFAGNPAAVCPLESWPEDSLLQSIAMENNLSETAYFAPEGDGYRLRWFTPVAEVDLCGHATLASAFALFSILGFPGDRISFQSRSGELKVERGEKGLLKMDFPAQPPAPCNAPDALIAALGHAPSEALRAQDYFIVFEDEGVVRNLRPDFSLMNKVDLRGVIITAPGSGDADFVSRFFAPKLGIPEDPVTGSAHCALIPFWSRRLGRRELHALQVSPRGGELFCADNGDRVSIAGRAVKFLEGTIEI
ncbi:MAG: PhzF family phenazine biosynthesis protein [Candidatus Latescibacterota bacterium]